MGDVPDLLRNRLRLDEEVVRSLRPALPRPFEVDHRIDHQIGDVDAPRPQIARHRLGENPLRRLGRREPRKAGLATQCRRVAGCDDCTLAGVDHRRGEPPRQIQQAHRVDLEVAIEDVRIDLAERAERAADGIVDHDSGAAEIVLHGRGHRLDLRGVGDIASIGFCARQLLLEGGKARFIPGEERDAVAARGEPSGERRAGAGPNA